MEKKQSNQTNEKKCERENECLIFFKIKPDTFNFIKRKNHLLQRVNEANKK